MNVTTINHLPSRTSLEASLATAEFVTTQDSDVLTAVAVISGESVVNAYRRMQEAED